MNEEVNAALNVLAKHAHTLIEPHLPMIKEVLMSAGVTCWGSNCGENVPYFEYDYAWFVDSMERLWPNWAEHYNNPDSLIYSTIGDHLAVVLWAMLPLFQEKYNALKKG